VEAALELVRRLGPARLAAMGAVTLALIAFFAFVISRVTQPGMAVLYSDLSFQDSNNIVRDLETKGIRYEVRGDGQTILAPKDMLAKLRMDFAGRGMPTGGGVGYEIFDKGDAFSSTSFVQNINQLRAMEGELSRTIRAFSRVQAARVHLVIPERKLFERDREAPSAAIVLKLAGDLDASQVRAVRHLVASAVEGLKPERISIADERGRLLADGAKGDQLMGVGLDEKQSGIERRLKTQIEDIIAKVVGDGRARVQVAAELEANRIESRSETFDPESRVVRSTQTRSESAQTSEQKETVSVANELPAATQPQQAQNQNQGPRDTSSKNEEVTNFEISRSTRTEVIEGGRLKRLSVAVVVDGVYAKGASGEATYAARPQEELDRITALVRTAMGFDQRRGDQLEVVNLRFADTPAAAVGDEKPGFFASMFSFSRDDLMRFVELAVLALLTLIVFFTVVRPLVKRMLSPDPNAGALSRPLSGPMTGAAMAISAGAGGMAGAAAVALPAGENQALRMLDIAKVQGQVQAQSIEKIGELVNGNPQESAAIIRQWVHDQR
jgi:flagellar M-ring protein FliF